MPTVKIPEIYRTALDKIATMPDDEITALREALSSIGVTMKPPGLTVQVRTRLKNPPPELDEIIQSLIGLSAARVGGEVSLENLARDVVGSFVRRKDAPKDYDQSIFEKRLISLLSIESLALSARAQEIQHDYERVFVSARIVSDIRSVFGISTVEPVGALIVHNFKITFFEENSMREIFFAMDNADLLNLRKLIDRADTKTTQLEEMIKKSGVQYFESK